MENKITKYIAISNIPTFSIFIFIITFINVGQALKSSIAVINDTYIYGNEESERWYWNKEVYPHPVETPQFCKRVKQSFVCDPDLVLTKKEADELDGLIRKLGKDTVCFCKYCPPNEAGIKIGVALMKNMYKDYKLLPFQNADNFAEYLRKKWRLGICDDDLIILVVTEEDQVSIIHSPILQKVFPSMVAEEIFLNNKIDFVQGNYLKGLEGIIGAYDNFLRKRLQYAPLDLHEENDDGQSSTSIIVITVVTIAFLVVIAVLIALLLFVRKKVTEDKSKFQFKGMLSKGYWTNKSKETLKPVSVNPIMTAGGVYEPCSIEDSVPSGSGLSANDDVKNSSLDKRLQDKLNQISDDSSEGEDEEITVIDHELENKRNAYKGVGIDEVDPRRNK